MTAAPPPRSLFVQCGGRELHVRQWGEPSAPVIIAWHGLTRNGADFAPLAAALSDEFCIYAPDTIGRGMSEWARVSGEYTLDTYAAHAEELMRALNIEHCYWLGTSMGGLIGMIVAARGRRIRRLLLNDVGPVLPPAALGKILAYAMSPAVLPTMTKFEEYLRGIYAGFGDLSDAEWRALAMSSCRRVQSGITLNHDVRITRVRAPSICDWDLYAQLDCPIMIFRGETSEVLTQEIADEMLSRQPTSQLINFPECGHAPFLNTPKQIKQVRGFFEG